MRDRILLAQHPGLLRGEVPVGLGDHGPDLGERRVKGEILPWPPAPSPAARRPAHSMSLVGLRECAGLRHGTVAVLGDHRQGALRQVAEVVGEIGVDPVDDRLVGVVAVLAERDLAQEEVAQLVDAVGIGERERIDHVADRLRHLLAAVEQEAVPEDPLGQRQVRRHQEGRPVDRVEADDVLADDVHVRRPVVPARVVLVREAARRSRSWSARRPTRT